MVAPMPMCPMAETCKGMVERPRSSLLLTLPGIILVVLGIVVILEPRILVWLVALALIVMGAAMLMMARFMKKVGARWQSER